MEEDGFRELAAAVTAEVEAVLARVDPGEVESLARAVLGARRIIVTGEGRSGLTARAFAMRLAHLGLPASVAGETTVPPAGSGDLLIAVSASGETGVVGARVEAAHRLGVTVAALTGTPESPLGRHADLLVAVSGVPSKQFSGTLFEQATLLLLDALVLLLQRRLGQSHADMEARHATLE